MKLQRKRKLEVEILTIFLLLISITAAVIISFTYERNYKSIMSYSKGTIDRASSLIINKIDCLFTDLQILPEMIVGLIKRHPTVSLENSELVSHLLDAVKYHKALYGFQAVTPDGSYLSSVDLKITGRPILAKSYPSNAAFLLTSIDLSSGTRVETWYYYDEDLNRISSEIIPNSGFQPLIRPWYEGAVKNRGPYWTDVFEFEVTGQPGINVSMPIYDDQQKLIAVVGANLSLSSFSAFLTEQRIGISGQAFILDHYGNILVPKDGDHKGVVSVAYSQFKRENIRDLVVSYKKEKFLASINSFPTTFGENWLIAIIVPFDDYFGAIIKTQKQVVLISFAILIITAILAAYFSKKISKPIVILADEVNKIKKLQLDSTVRIDSHIEEISRLDSSIAAMRSTIHSFSRYVPKEIVKKLIEMGQEIQLGGERREITLLFSDITGFTTFAEGMTLEALNAFLTEYFDGMSKTILKNMGTIDKYIGDGMMAFWDAPDFLPDHAAKGCIAALQCQAFVKEFNERQSKKGLPLLQTRIGLNTGEVIVGNVGTMERMNYTVIGDVVNGAERIMNMNKVYHSSIVIGEEVVKRIGDRFVTRPLDIAELKGKKGKVKIYELMALRGEANSGAIQLAELFTSAYEAYHRGALGEAKGLFEALLSKFPNDYPATLYLERLVSI